MLHDQNAFLYSLSALFPEGYGANQTAFESFEGDVYAGKAEFAVESGKVVGLGLFSLYTDIPCQSQKARASAMAWFDKM